MHSTSSAQHTCRLHVFVTPLLPVGSLTYIWFGIIRKILSIVVAAKEPITFAVAFSTQRHCPQHFNCRLLLVP